MSDPVEFSQHAKDMLTERNIAKEWVLRTINAFDSQYIGDDNNLHYTKAIAERDERVLHVVINPTVQPNRVVTLFFDRRLRRK